MYIDSIKLHNIRGFQNLEFNFKRPNNTHAGWTVFTGDNGSGKSTLLKAIAIGLVGKDIARALQPSFHRWVGNGAIEASIQLNIMRTKGDDTLANKGNAPKSPFSAKIIMTNSGKETVLQAVTTTSKKNNYTIPDRTIWSNNANGWFSCGYGPFRRIFGASSEAMQQMITPTTARFATMFQEAASLAEADRWLRDLNHKKLENRQAEREQFDVLLAILKDELMPNQIVIDRQRQDNVDAQCNTNNFNVEHTWKSARQTKELKEVHKTLKRMTGSRERCMYCCDSHGTDIEHFWPKSSYPQRMFDWLNLLLCCTECGRMKSNKFPLQNGIPSLIDAAIDDHGLLGWCFTGTGQKIPPFSIFCEQFPNEWIVCTQKFS